MARVSLLIPAYNEREVVPYLLEELEAFIRARRLTPQDLEAVIVDDGSRDGTYQALQQELQRRPGLQPFVKLGRHSKNLGKTAALVTAASLATGEVFVVFDADLQYTLDDALKLAEKVLKEGYDLAVGWKQGDYPKRVVSGIYNWLSRKLFQLPVHDMNAMKAIRAEVFYLLALRKDWHRYIVPLAVERGFTITEEKVLLRPRRAGRSKYTGFWRIVVGIADLLAVKFQLTVMRKPLLYLGTLSAVFFIAGLAVGLFALWLRYGLHHGYRPLLYLVILLLLLGAISLTLGLLGEVVSGVEDRFDAFERRLFRLVRPKD